MLAEDHFWAALCRALGLDDVVELGFAERLPRTAELQARLADAVRQRPRDELVRELLAADVPVAPVADRASMLADPHLRARGIVTSGSLGAASRSAIPIVFTHHPAGRVEPPPEIDEHHGTGFAPR